MGPARTDRSRAIQQWTVWKSDLLKMEANIYAKISEYGEEAILSCSTETLLLWSMSPSQLSLKAEEREPETQVFS